MRKKMSEKTLQNLHYKTMVKRGFRLIAESLQHNISHKEFSKRLRATLDQIYIASDNDYYVLYNAIEETFRKGKARYAEWQKTLSYTVLYDNIFYACKRTYETNKTELKRRNLTRAMDRGFIFFMCSKHENCGHDHVDLQGKIYVDKDWRNRVSQDDYLAVLSYIELRKIKTVQQVMGKPYWLTTRPYCRHRFYPVPTRTVLESPQNILLQKYAVEPKKIPEDPYYKIRSEVYTMLNNITPCKEFDKKRRRVS